MNQIKYSCDVLVIAGDWSHLCYQQDYDAVLNWCDNEFIPLHTHLLKMMLIIL